MYSENCRTLGKKQKMAQINERIHLCSWIRIVNIAKMSILPKAIYRIKKKKKKKTLSKYQWHFSQNYNSKICMEPQKSSIVKAILKKNKAEDIMLPDLKLHYKVVCLSLSHIQLCDPMDCSLPGSSVHGIVQARILEWISISFSREPS